MTLSFLLNATESHPQWHRCQQAVHPRGRTKSRWEDAGQHGKTNQGSNGIKPQGMKANTIKGLQDCGKTGASGSWCSLFGGQLGSRYFIIETHTPSKSTMTFLDLYFRDILRCTERLVKNVAYRIAWNIQIAKCLSTIGEVVKYTSISCTNM